MNIINVGSFFDERCLPLKKKMTEQQICHIAHRRTATPEDIKSMHHTIILLEIPTPLRLTASQTATTRAMMVSGIRGALDTAPTLHFVEQVNGEEWIKVMDEYLVPNCAALLEPGREFLLLLDNAPSRACRQASDHYKTVLNGTAEFQPPCSPDLVLMWNESSRHSSFSSSRKSRRIASLLTRLCHRTWTGSRWMFEKTGTAWGRRLKGLRSRPHRTVSRHGRHSAAQNTSCSRIRHSVALSTDTHRQHHKTQTARFPTQHGPPGSSEVQGPIFTSQNPKLGPIGPFFERPAGGRTQHVQSEWAHVQK